MLQCGTSGVLLVATKPTQPPMWRVAGARGVFTVDCCTSGRVFLTGIKCWGELVQHKREPHGILLVVMSTYVAFVLPRCQLPMRPQTCCLHPSPPSAFDLAHAWRDRFCSLSWYDRQLVENSRSGDTLEGPLKRDEEQEKGEKQEVVEGSDSGDPILSPSARVHGDSGGGDGGFGFGVRARPADASVMATLKARDGY